MTIREKSEADLIQRVVGFAEQGSPKLHGQFVCILFHGLSYYVNVAEDCFQQPTTEAHSETATWDLLQEGGERRHHHSASRLSRGSPVQGIFTVAWSQVFRAKNVFSENEKGRGKVAVKIDCVYLLGSSTSSASLSYLPPHPQKRKTYLCSRPCRILGPPLSTTYEWKKLMRTVWMLTMTSFDIG